MPVERLNTCTIENRVVAYETIGKVVALRPSQIGSRRVKMSPSRLLGADELIGDSIGGERPADEKRERQKRRRRANELHAAAHVGMKAAVVCELEKRRLKNSYCSRAPPPRLPLRAASPRTR